MMTTLLQSHVFEASASWLVTFALHSTVLLFLVWTAVKAVPARLENMQELAWKTALVMGFLTASVQVGFEINPLQWRIKWSQAQTETLVTPFQSEAQPVPFNLVPEETGLNPLPMNELSEPSKPGPLQQSKASFPWLEALGWLWMLGSLFFLARLAANLWRLKRILRSRTPLTEGQLFEKLQALKQKAQIRRNVRLSLSEEVQVPIAFGLFRSEICVPLRACTHLSASQQASMLAHELAHLHFRDPLWLRFMHILEAVFFFQPLLRIANRHLGNLAELRCDDWAVHRVGRPRDLAHCLTEVAGWAFTNPPLPVPGITKGEPILRKRIQRLLNNSTPRHKAPTWLGRTFMICFLGMVAMAAPAVLPTGQADVTSPAVASADTVSAGEAAAASPALATVSATVEGTESQPALATTHAATVANAATPTVATVASEKNEVGTSAATSFSSSALAVSPAAVATRVTSALNQKYSFYKNSGDHYEEIRELTISAPKILIVDGGRNGGIAVKGWDKPEVHIVAKVSVNAEDDELAEAKFADIQVIAGDKIYAEGPSDHRWGVSFEIYAPRNMDADLETYNGGVSLSGLRGDLRFKALNGGVKLSNLAGNVYGRTTNGGLSVDLESSSWDGDGLDVETTNGGIVLSMPEDFNGQLKTGTVNGRLDFRFPITVQGEINKKFSTVLGKGGPPIRVVTTNGSVVIKKY